MARMIPAVIPPDTQSNAEKAVFAVISERLDENCTVFHSFDLLTPKREGKLVDGEIDFLIFSPSLGLLILEVKGGGIRYDGDAGIWYSNEHTIKNPFQQAEGNKHDLRDFLYGKLGRNLPKVSFGHAVCFPDVFTMIDQLPSGANEAICITGSDLQYIDKSIAEIMESFPNLNINTLTRDEEERIRQVLMPRFEYGTSLIDRIGQAERDFYLLTENQCQVLDFITQHKRVIIEGCAGSGKTVMAVKKARELAAQGKSVLLLAYNLMISAQLADDVSDLENVTAQNYHSFCQDLLRNAGQLPEEGPSEDYWGLSLPQRMAEFLEDNPVKYDAVIVDEGQDFWVEWWVTVDELVKPDGHFYIFYDPAQNIRRTQMEFPITAPPFTLTSNCRNTKAVFDTLQPYAGTEIEHKDGVPQGEHVRQYHLSDARDRRKQLSRILHELVQKQGLERSRIAILGGHSMHHTCIGDDNQIGSFKIIEGLTDESNCIYYYTYMKFKGCEADAVILLDVNRDDNRWDNTGLYTAISRAKHLLYIIWADK